MLFYFVLLICTEVFLQWLISECIWKPYEVKQMRVYFVLSHKKSREKKKKISPGCELVQIKFNVIMTSKKVNLCIYYAEMP